MRVRLRPTLTDEQFAEYYGQPYSHVKWPEHVQRVQYTTDVIRAFMVDHPIACAADLSCGDKAVLSSLGISTVVYGDVQGSNLDVRGKIEDTIHDIHPVDLFVLSETLEHLDDPDYVLRFIRQRTKYLVVTTPEGEDNTANWEHLWGWNGDDVNKMLHMAGFYNVHHSSLLELPYYTYQVWIVS